MSYKKIPKIDLSLFLLKSLGVLGLVMVAIFVLFSTVNESTYQLNIIVGAARYTALLDVAIKDIELSNSVTSTGNFLVTVFGKRVDGQDISVDVEVTPDGKLLARTITVGGQAVTLENWDRKTKKWKKGKIAARKWYE